MLSLNPNVQETALVTIHAITLMALPLSAKLITLGVQDGELKKKIQNMITTKATQEIFSTKVSFVITPEILQVA